MNEDQVQPPTKRPALMIGSAVLLSALLGLTVAAALLPLRAPSLLASGLEGSEARVEAAFAPDVEPALRAAVRAELKAQIESLRGLEPRALSPGQARAAALPSERLTEFLADDRLDPAECRSFVDLGRRSRAEGP